MTTQPSAPASAPPATATATATAAAAAAPGDPVEPAAEQSRHVAHVFNLAVMAIGGVGLYFLTRELGWDQLRALMAGLGRWFAVILAIDLAGILCDAAALNTFMRPEARMVSYWRVLGAQASGRAINVLTPGGALGEATKLTLLVSRAPRNRVLSSIVLLNLSQLYLSVAIILIGTPITLLLVDLPDYITAAVGVGLAVLVPAMIALAIVIHRGAMASLVGALRRSRVVDRERAERWAGRLLEVDRHIGELHRHRSAGTWKGILWVLASKLLGWASMITMLHAVDVSLQPSLVVGVLSVGVLVIWIASIVPMGLGLADGGNYALFGMLGATGAHGVVYTMLSRARSLAFAIAGLAAMAALHGLDRLAIMRMQRKLRELRDHAGRGG